MHLKARLPELAVALASLAFAVACASFVGQRSLASFADDSVNYLIMAQVFSPWQAASPPVAEAFLREAFYPPLFPFVLALAGAAHDVARAHMVTALLLAACLPLTYALGARWLDNRLAAAIATLAVALLPSLWVNAKGILSEPLYCMVLLATLLVLDIQGGGRRRLLLLAAGLCALVLTRTAGLALVAGYALWAVSRRDWPVRERAQALVPAAVAVVAYMAWMALRPSSVLDVNVQLLGEAGGSLASSVSRQALSIVEAWIGSLILYWVDGRPAQAALACLVGVAAIAGLSARLFSGKPDAWVMAAYVATFLAWPFDDQMGRFLFPALPVLVLYAFWAVGTAASRLGKKPSLAHALAGVLLLALTLPAMGFVYQRARMPVPQAAITDWYRTPNLLDARARADTHLELLAAMDTIRLHTRSGDRVMWVTPAYLALLAGRSGVRAPSPGLEPAAYRAAVREARPDYVFLSAYHPRNTVSDQAWQAGLRALYGELTPVHVGTRRGGELVTHMLLKAK